MRLLLTKSGTGYYEASGIFGAGETPADARHDFISAMTEHHERQEQLGPELAWQLEFLRQWKAAEIRQSDDELRVIGLINDAMSGIRNLNGRKLKTNQAELTQAVHVLRSFVQQATLSRLDLFDASDWWE